MTRIRISLALITVGILVLLGFGTLSSPWFGHEASIAGVRQISAMTLQDVDLRKEPASRSACRGCHATAGGVGPSNKEPAPVESIDAMLDVHIKCASSALECRSCHEFESKRALFDRSGQPRASGLRAAEANSL